MNYKQIKANLIKKRNKLQRLAIEKRKAELIKLKKNKELAIIKKEIADLKKETSIFAKIRTAATSPEAKTKWANIKRAAITLDKQMTKLSKKCR